MAKRWRGQFDRTSQRPQTSGFPAWGSVARAVVGAAWRIPIPVQGRGMVGGMRGVDRAPRHDSERAATSNPDYGGNGCGGEFMRSST